MIYQGKYIEVVQALELILQKAKMHKVMLII